MAKLRKIRWWNWEKWNHGDQICFQAKPKWRKMFFALSFLFGQWMYTWKLNIIIVEKGKKYRSLVFFTIDLVFWQTEIQKENRNRNDNNKDDK